MRYSMKGEVVTANDGYEETTPANEEGEAEAERMVRLVLDALAPVVEAGEIDLSAPTYTIGDAGCTALCNILSAPITTTTTTTPNLFVNITTLDLEANGLSSLGGCALARALQAGAAPSLAHLNLGCNTISGHAAKKIAAALRNACCPLLQSLDLHGNAIGNHACVALGDALANGACPKLQMLDLSANRIEDAGCNALAALFGTRPCCPLLAHVHLRENGIESIETLLAGATLHSNNNNNNNTTNNNTTVTTTTLPDLVLLDLSWNSIGTFEPLARALSGSSTAGGRVRLACPALAELDLCGNALSDAACQRFCNDLQASGATPLLQNSQTGGGGGPDQAAGVVLVVQAETNGDAGRRGSEGRLRRCMRLIADGDATNSQVCRLALWESTRNSTSPTTSTTPSPTTSTTASTTTSPTTSSTTASAKHNGNEGSPEMPLAFDLLRRDGFVVRPPLVCSRDMEHLASLMDRLEIAGWPPVFCFMSDSVWDFVAEHVWPVVRTLLGVDCVLDSGSAFAWSLKATGKSTFPRDGEFRSWQNAVSSINNTVPKEKEEGGHRGFGSSFGLPHRDYSAADSLHHDECEGGDENGYPKATIDHPAILNVWIPLNEATLDNGCMYVVPREFDTDFARTDGHHAHMNPATEVQRGLSSKIHFPLHGVRALPAPAGSLIAWYGNTIHWGSTCSRYAKVPRKSIALTFRRGDIQVGAGDALDEAPRVHRPSPPITLSQARDMSPAFRLALISRSLLLYNQWHALADDAVPPLIYETTAIPEEKRQKG